MPNINVGVSISVVDGISTRVNQITDSVVRMGARASQSNRLASSTVNATRSAYGRAATSVGGYVGRLRESSATLRVVRESHRRASAAVKRYSRHLKENAAAGRAGRGAVDGLTESIRRYAGVAAAGLFVGAAITSAVEFEEKMADVRKVIEVTDEQFSGITQSVDEMSRRLPVGAAGLAEIMAAAGQAGVAADELNQYTESAAKMAIAFDVSAESAGRMMFSWRDSMGLSRERVLLLADTVNHLSNRFNATAPDLAEVVTRVGGLGKTAGVSEQSVAALGTALLATGAAPEIVSTSIKNFVNSLGSGEFATKRQYGIFSMLGLDPTEVADSMITDSESTIMNVLERVQKIAPAQKNSVIGQLFGEESKLALAPLVANLDNLRNAFDEVSSSAQYSGSSQAEFEVRANTSANRLQLFRNRIDSMNRSIGNRLIPVMMRVLQHVEPMIDRITAWAERNDNLTNTLTQIADVVAAVANAVVWLGDQFGGLDNLAYGLAAVKIGVVALNAVFWALSANPVSLTIAAIVAGVSALAVGAAWVWQNWDSVLGWFDEELSAIRDVINGVSSAWAALFGGENSVSARVDSTTRAVTENVSRPPPPLNPAPRTLALPAGSLAGPPNQGGAGQRAEVGGKINLHITSEGRPIVRSLEKTGPVDLSVNTGHVNDSAP